MRPNDQKAASSEEKCGFSATYGENVNKRSFAYADKLLICLPLCPTTCSSVHLLERSILRGFPKMQFFGRFCAEYRTRGAEKAYGLVAGMNSKIGEPGNF
jgi:hypothetical protein